MRTAMGFSSDLTSVSNDLQMFNYCNGQNNITIVVKYIKISHFEKFFMMLKEVIEKEDCYLINIYLPDEDRVVRLTRNTNVNRIYMSIEESGNNLGFISNLELFKLVKTLSEEPIVGDKFMRQTFLYMISHVTEDDSFQPLSQLQNERNWAVIIYSTETGDDFRLYSAANMKIPLHRIVLTNYEPFNDLALKNLIDVTKEPNFSRYDYYRSLTFKGNFFNETCLSGIT